MQLVLVFIDVGIDDDVAGHRAESKHQHFFERIGAAAPPLAWIAGHRVQHVLLFFASHQFHVGDAVVDDGRPRRRIEVGHPP